MVKKPKPVIIWNNKALIYFNKAYERIKEESYSNAEKVKTGIVKAIDSLADRPEKYAYRIAYKHTEKEIRILRIRHVKQEPKEYWSKNYVPRNPHRKCRLVKDPPIINQ